MQKEEPKKRIAVFIPVYNEAETLERVLRSIPQTVRGCALEVFVVDDHSSDGSAAIARIFTPWVTSLAENRGVGYATKIGFREIINAGEFDFVVKFDADGQHRLEFFLEEVVERLLEGYDIVVCSRFHKLSDQTHTPVDRILLNAIFTEMIKKITGWSITDARSGYMGFPIEIVEKITPKLIVPHYGIPMEILLRIWQEKPRPAIFEIPHPALYNGDISKKIKEKYGKEAMHLREERLRQNWSALLMVIQDMSIPKEYLLKANGLHVPPAFQYTNGALAHEIA